MLMVVGISLVVVVVMLGEVVRLGGRNGGSDRWRWRRRRCGG